MSRGALTRRGLLFAVTAISLYLLAPALIAVFGAFDELDEISPLWFVAMVALQVGSFACMWGILRLAVRAHQWEPVILSQLAANSFGRVVPGGLATVGAVQYAMLVRGGVPPAAAASGITASACRCSPCRRSSPGWRSTRIWPGRRALELSSSSSWSWLARPP